MKYFVRSLLLSFMLSMLCAPNAPATNPTIAVIGDSLATGAVTSAQLSFDANTLWRIVTGAQREPAVGSAIPDAEFFNILPGTIPQPKRLWPEPSEYRSFYEWIGLNFMAAVARLYFDTEEYSWGYLVGRKLNTDAANILIAAENGARSESAVYQADRILTANNGVLPDKIFVMFAGNDLCGFTSAAVNSGEDYAANIQRAVEYLVRHARDDGQSTEIVIMAPLAILQLVDSPAILGKDVYAHGKQQTCSELQKSASAMQVTDPANASNSFVGMMVGMLPPSPVTYCRTLYPPEDPAARGEQLAFLGNRLRSYRDLGKKMASDLNTSLAAKKRPITVRWIEQTGALMFQPEDIANDCFHLSVAGQAKLAKTIAGAI